MFKLKNLAQSLTLFCDEINLGKSLQTLPQSYSDLLNEINANSRNPNI